MVELSDLLIIIFVLSLTGGVAGIFAGLLGIGGGIVIVPVLFIIFEWLQYPSEIQSHLAIGTSLTTSIFTAFSSTYAHYRKGSIDLDLAKGCAFPIAIGAMIGAQIAGSFSGNVLKIIFMLLALVIAFNLSFPKTRQLAEQLPSKKIMSGIMGLSGILSSMIGIAGGSINVPILMAFNRPIHRAVGTSAGLGLVISIPGGLTYIWLGFGNPLLPEYTWGYVSWLGILCIVPMTMFAAPWGVRLAHCLNQFWLKRVFACFLMIVAVRMLVRWLA